MCLHCITPCSIDCSGYAALGGETILRYVWVALAVISETHGSPQAVLWVCTFNRRLRGSLGAALTRKIGLRAWLVQAGNAKMRVRAKCRVFLPAGPHAGFGDGKFCFPSRPLGEAQDVVCALVLRQNGPKSDPRHSHCVLHASFIANHFKTHS